MTLCLQMKMPSKKFAHIPVYTLGFEGPPRVTAARATATPRRDAFQCVPLPTLCQAMPVTQELEGEGPVSWDAPRR